VTTTLEEKDAIRETIASYCFYFDGGEFDQWLELFTDDCVYDAGHMGMHRGKEGLRALVADVKKTLPPGGKPALKHCVSNEIVRVTGAEATAQSYVTVYFAKGANEIVPGLIGRYEDRLVKRGGRWLFQSRKIHFELTGDLSALQAGG
jgi:3-phenylpropionate/cinnamic acid dioxygenase small subunit